MRGIEMEANQNEAEIAAESQQVLKGKVLSWGKLRRVDSFPVEAGRVSNAHHHASQDGEKLGNELEALGIYDVMRYIEAPICTLCIGKAWGEAALLLAAGDRGCRAALPSSSIMIREPVAKFDGQVSDVVLAREEFSSIKGQMVNILSEHTGKPSEQIEQDIRWPKYFSPSAAVEYGIIDRVVSNDLVQENQALMLDLKSADLSQGSGIST